MPDGAHTTAKIILKPRQVSMYIQGKKRVCHKFMCNYFLYAKIEESKGGLQASESSIRYSERSEKKKKSERM